MDNLNLSTRTTGQNLYLSCLVLGSRGLASNPYIFIQARLGRTDITSVSTATCATKSWMATGSKPPTKPKPQSIAWSRNIIACVRIKNWEWDHQYQKLRPKNFYKQKAAWQLNDQDIVEYLKLSSLLEIRHGDRYAIFYYVIFSDLWRGPLIYDGEPYWKAWFPPVFALLHQRGRRTTPRSCGSKKREKMNYEWEQFNNAFALWRNRKFAYWKP